MRREEGFPLTLKKKYLGPTCCSHPEVDMHGRQSAPYEYGHHERGAGAIFSFSFLLLS